MFMSRYVWQYPVSSQGQGDQIYEVDKIRHMHESQKFWTLMAKSFVIHNRCQVILTALCISDKHKSGGKSHWKEATELIVVFVSVELALVPQVLHWSSLISIARTATSQRILLPSLYAKLSSGKISLMHPEQLISHSSPCPHQSNLHTSSRH